MHRLFAAALFALVGLAFVTPASAGDDDAAVKAYVSRNIDDGIAILKDADLSAAQRKDKIAALLGHLLDTRRIGLFAIGPVAKSASQDEIGAYLSAFHDFMIQSYVSRLGGYGGQTLRITGVIDRAPGDYVVTAVLVDPAAPDDPDPIQVALRVFKTGDNFAVVDASIAGVWLGLAQRDDFRGFLSQHGDKLPALTEHLKEMTARFTAG